MQLNPDEHLIALSNSVATVTSTSSTRLISLDPQQEAIEQPLPELPMKQSDPQFFETMSIDPAKITVDEIDRYERMMQGTGCPGKSNSEHQLLKQSQVRHTWRHLSDKVMEVTLDQPTSLIQLNLDV